MAGQPTATVTVDRVSNNGNAIAQETLGGKDIHVPATADVGSSLEVRLVEKGSYVQARLVDGADRVAPQQPGASPTLLELGKDLLNPGRNSSHSFEVSKSVDGENRGSSPEELDRMSSRKM